MALHGHDHLVEDRDFPLEHSVDVLEAPLHYLRLLLGVVAEVLEHADLLFQFLDIAHLRLQVRDLNGLLGAALEQVRVLLLVQRELLQCELVLDLRY